MKKILYIFLSCTFLSSCFLFTSCDLETSDNGKLDGNWQLRQIDTLSTGGVCDMTYSYIYWGIENKLLQVRDIDNNNLRILFRFDKQGDHLTIHSPHQVITKDELKPLEDAELLTPLGIIETEDTFIVETLSSGNMTLKNERFRLHFRKY